MNGLLHAVCLCLLISVFYASVSQGGTTTVPIPNSDGEHDNDDGDMLINPGSGNGKVADSTSLWEDGIVYYKLKNLPKSLKKSFKKAMSTIQNAVKINGVNCITFRKKNKYPDARHWMEVKKSNSYSCASGVGTWSGSTPVYISEQCSFGSLQHEILHAMGFYHEQSRNDRDKYIIVNYDNIRSGAAGNFAKVGIRGTTGGTKYDYGSILHYPGWAFSKNRNPTIVPLPTNAAAAALIGQRKGLSACDIEEIQVVYGCKEKAVICKDN